MLFGITNAALGAITELKFCSEGDNYLASLACEDDVIIAEICIVKQQQQQQHGSRTHCMDDKDRQTVGEGAWKWKGKSYFSQIR